MQTNVGDRTINEIKTKEIDYIIKRYNNDFASKCKFYNLLFKILKNEYLLDFNNENDEMIQKIIVVLKQQFAHNDKIRSDNNNQIITHYSFHTKEYNYVVASDCSGLLIKKTLKTDLDIFYVYKITWINFLKRTVELIKQSLYFSELEEKTKFFAVNIKDMMIQMTNNKDIFDDNQKIINTNLMFQLNINEFDTQSKILINTTEYFLKFVKFSQENKYITDFFKRYDCNSGKELFNKLFLDKSFLEGTIKKLYEMYNIVIFKSLMMNKISLNEQYDFLNKIQCNLIFLLNIKRIKNLIGLKIWLGDSLIFNSDICVIKKIVKDKIILVSNTDKEYEVKLNDLIGNTVHYNF